jgi:hypothetical protein
MVYPHLRAICQPCHLLWLEYPLQKLALELCQRERWSESDLMDAADTAFPHLLHTEAIHSYLMRYLRAASTEAGHKAAGHGY